MSLAVTAQGDLIAGTDPGGLVLAHFARGKSLCALFDAPLREIHSLAAAADGSIYALGLSDAASGRQTSAAFHAAVGCRTAVRRRPQLPSRRSMKAVLQFNQQGQTPRSRSDVSSARSAVFRILPDGGSDVVWSSTSITAFAIAPALQPGSVLNRHGREGTHLFSHKRWTGHAAVAVERGSDFFVHGAEADRFSRPQAIRANCFALGMPCSAGHL